MDDLYRNLEGYRRLTTVAAALPLLLLALLAISRGPATAAQVLDTIVRCDPSTVTGPVGLPLSVDIYVENVVDLYGADVRMAFDTSSLQVMDVDPAADGTQIAPLNTFLSPDFVVRRVADNTAGTIWYAATQVNPTEAVSGSGPLARITFLASRPGQITLPITYHKLGTRVGIEIPATARNCSVTAVQVEPDLSIYMPIQFAQP